MHRIFAAMVKRNGLALVDRDPEEARVVVSTGVGVRTVMKVVPSAWSTGWRHICGYTLAPRW